MLLVHGAVSFAVVGIVFILVLVFSIIYCVKLRKMRVRLGLFLDAIFAS